ncbi:MAG: ABC transporter ATP-binding protein [Lachnospiraceae bacterium]|nr:ABC transporter ATP-binding protein [Lachnospiraceae bacterium]
MIVFKDVSKIYKMGDEELRALDRASLHIREGEFVAIVGPSGSGKSTLMNIMGCLDTADEGEYLLDGQPIEKYSERELTKIRNRKIGFIFQSFNLIADLTAEENVELPLIYQRVPAKERKERVKEALENVDLYDRRRHRPNQLSGGQQQRVAIARAMAGKPALFLADEPTGNLDQKTGQQIMDLFRRLNAQGHTIVLITHDEHVAAQAGRAIRIMDGRVEELGGEELPDTEAEGSPADEIMPADEALPDAEAWPAEDVDDLFADEPGEEVSE